MRAKAGLLSVSLIMAFACLVSAQAPVPPQPAQDGLEAQDAGQGNMPLAEGHHNPGAETPPWLKEKQKKAILSANLASSKKDAAELAALAQEIQGEMGKPDFKTLSPDCVARLNRIEKLAKKIREEMKAY